MRRFMTILLALVAILCFIVTGNAQGFDQMKWQTISKISAREMSIIAVVSRESVSVILKDAIEFHLFEGGESIALKFKSGKQCLYGFGVGSQKLTDQEEEQIEIAKQQQCAQEALEQQAKEAKSDIVQGAVSDEPTENSKSKEELSETDADTKLDKIRVEFHNEGERRFNLELTNSMDPMDRLAFEGAGLLNSVSEFSKERFLSSLCWLGNRYMHIISPFLATHVALDIYKEYAWKNTWRLDEDKPTLQDVVVVTNQVGYYLLNSGTYIDRDTILSKNLQLYNESLFDLLNSQGKIR